MSSFVFATCAPGYEAALKSDIAREHPELRLSFSRPGLLTFKRADASEAEPERPSAWARVWGVGLGLAADVPQLLERIPVQIRRLHVFARDPDADGARELVADMRRALCAGGRFESEPQSRAGELVADVIVASTETPFVGVHRHGPRSSGWPGGDIPVDVPSAAPSRAYAKLEQAARFGGIEFRAGQTAVEIGSAPGGAAYALVQRGLHVVGVDPGAMDQAVLALVGPGGARVSHVRATLGEVRYEGLPSAVDWLLCDVNLAPPVALHGLARLLPAWRATLRGAVITLKMNDAAMREGLPRWIERLRELGFERVVVTHLPANRQELCAIGWTARGARQATGRRQRKRR